MAMPAAGCSSQIAQADRDQVVAEHRDERRHQQRVIFENELRASMRHAREDAVAAVFGLSERQNPLQDHGKVGRECLLGHMIRRAGLEGIDRNPLVPAASHQDDRHLRVLLPEFLDEREAVHLRHPHVGEDDRGRILCDRVQGFDAIVGE